MVKSPFFGAPLQKVFQPEFLRWSPQISARPFAIPGKRGARTLHLGGGLLWPRWVKGRWTGGYCCLLLGMKGEHQGNQLGIFFPCGKSKWGNLSVFAGYLRWAVVIHWLRSGTSAFLLIKWQSFRISVVKMQKFTIFIGKLLVKSEVFITKILMITANIPSFHTCSSSATCSPFFAAKIPWFSPSFLANQPITFDHLRRLSSRRKRSVPASNACRKRSICCWRPEVFIFLSEKHGDCWYMLAYH